MTALPGNAAAPLVPIAKAPGAWPLLGHFIPMRRDPLAFMGSLRSHGDLVTIKAGPMPVVVVCEPTLAHQVMTDPDPERFDPDRWLALGRSSTGPAITRQAYFPFGGGPTKCIGEQFATAEAVLALASILARWNVELRDPDATLKLDTRIVLLPRRLPVRVTARAQ